jgi:hypothetical protein
LDLINAPSPLAPSAIKSASENAQIKTVSRTYFLVKPWRITKAFWAPIAIIKDSPARKPGRTAIILKDRAVL